MIDEVKAAYAAARRAHWELADATERTRVALARSPDVGELADAVYALRETSTLLEDLRKEADRLKGELERQCCATWVKIGRGDPVRTAYCTGSPDVKQTPKTPRPGTPEYGEFCRHFGVDPGGFFRPHWPSLLEAMTDAASRGLPAPPGCDPAQTWTVFKVKVTKRRPVLDGDEAPEVQRPEHLRELYDLMKALPLYAALTEKEAADDGDEPAAAPLRGEPEEETPF